MSSKPPHVSPHLPATITASEFHQILSRYDAVITRLTTLQSFKSKLKPAAAAAATAGKSTLAELDEWRCFILPWSIKYRPGSAGKKDSFMTKPELEDLLRCKLKRGKPRPTLPSLVASNPPSTIESTTTAAFKSFPATSLPRSSDLICSAITELSKLRGIGPATASYCLAGYAPSYVPVFSDEGYRWIFFEECEEGGKGKGKGWERKLKYDLKEYRAYVERVWDVVRRLKGGDGGDGVTAEEVEKVGFVLGKEWELGEVCEAGVTREGVEGVAKEEENGKDGNEEKDTKAINVSKDGKDTEIAKDQSLPENEKSETKQPPTKPEDEPQTHIETPRSTKNRPPQSPHTKALSKALSKNIFAEAGLPNKKRKTLTRDNDADFPPLPRQKKKGATTRSSVRRKVSE